MSGFFCLDPSNLFERGKQKDQADEGSGFFGLEEKAEYFNRNFGVITTVSELLGNQCSEFERDAFLCEIHAYQMDQDVVPFSVTHFVTIAKNTLTISTQLCTHRPVGGLRNILC